MGHDGIAQGDKAARQQTVLVALWVAVSMVLGGGGSPNPLSELALQAICAALFLVYLALERQAPSKPWPGQLLPIVGIVLALPVLQLVPLPPALWHALPGRALEQAALAQIGAADSWRAFSIAPHLTLASLLAILPPAMLALLVARQSQPGRRTVLAVIALVALASAVLGAAQMAGPGDAFRLYPQTSLGWLSGFHANRNAAADVLLIGALAAGAWFAGRPRRGTGDRPAIFLFAGVLFVLLVALLFTGSRAGIALLALVVPSLALMPMLHGKPAARKIALFAAIAGVAILLAGLALVNARLGLVAARFGMVQDYRLGLWQDSWTAMLAYWPWGSGVGTFVPAFLPHESLAAIDPTLPNRAHNEFLELAIEAGVAGLLALAVVGAAILRLFVRSWRDPDQPRATTFFALQGFILIAVHGFVDYPLRNMAVASLAGIALGMLVPPAGETARRAARRPAGTGSQGAGK